MKPESFYRRAERLLELEAEVDAAACAFATETEPSWRRKRRTALLMASLKYGRALNRYLNRRTT